MAAMTTHDLLSPSFSFDKHQSFSLNFNPEFTSRLLLDHSDDEAQVELEGEDDEDDDDDGEAEQQEELAKRGERREGRGREIAREDREEEVEERADGSTEGAGEEQSVAETEDVEALGVPKHPIPAMQDAFAESMLEAAVAHTRTPKKGDSAARRKVLLDQRLSEDTHAARWRQQPGQQWHQLWKLMAQISFGIYLLLNGLAKDDGQVLTILQGHVDEVDEFLETTLDDFDLAQEDIDVRLKHLMMPLENIEIFDGMLEDRQFRLQIVAGNERIEHIITRTAKAMNDALQDVEQGLEATKVFAVYLAEEEQGGSWQRERPDMQRVFEAMKANAVGWNKAYVSLQGKGKHLGAALAQLGSIVAEMDRRAGEISRRMRFSISPVSSRKSTVSSPPSSPPPQKSHSSRPSASSLYKELPADPILVTPAVRVAVRDSQNFENLERISEPSQDSNTGTKKEVAPEPKPQAEVEPQPEPERQPEPELERVSKAEAEIKPVPQPEPNPGPDSETEPLPQPVLEPEHKPEPEAAPTLRPLTYMSVREPTLQIDDLIDYQIPAFPQPPGTPRSDDFRTLSQGSQSSLNPEASSGPQNSSRKVSGTSSIKTLQPRPPIPLSPPLSTSPDSSYFSNTSSAASPSIPLARPSRGPNLSSFPSPSNQFPRTSQTQTFHPMPANTHSPLQRPWTAVPSNHQQHHSSMLNLRNSSGTTKSHMTAITTNATERHLKQKKSGFGWFKKAFSLSEEERATFDMKRGLPVAPARPMTGAMVDRMRIR